MKQALFLFILLQSAKIVADEVSDVRLFTPITYEAQSTSSENFSSWFQLKAADLLNKNIKSTTLAKLEPYKKDLSEIFNKPGELDKFLNSAIDEAAKKNLNSGINDKSVTNFLSDIGNSIVGTIIEKGMSSKGVVDPVRKKIWKTKLLKKFNECTSNAKNALYEANQCMTALCAGIVPNIGTAVVFEMTKSKLLDSVDLEKRDSFLNSRVNSYIDCLTPAVNKYKDKVSQDEVTTCAVSSIKAGVLTLAEGKFSEAVSGTLSSPSKIGTLKENVWPKFNICLNSVGKDTKSKIDLADQFNNCIDNLILDTGVLLVQDKIKTNETVLKLYSPNDAKTLILDKTASFKKCFENLKTKSIRKNGLIDVDICKEQITNEVTYKVVLQNLSVSAKEKFKNQPELIKKSDKAGKTAIDSCWNNQQNEQKRNECLKSTILSFSNFVASEKMDQAIPHDTNGKNQIKINALKNLKTCLDNNLPENLAESNDLASKIEECGDKVTDSVSNIAAVSQIKQKASPYMNESQVNILVKNLVDEKFNSCLHKDFSDSNMNRCLDELKINAGKEISKVAFAQKVNDYFKENGGLSSLGLNQDQVDAFIRDLSNKTNKCLDTRTEDAIDNRIDKCLKSSVRDIGFYFGELKFNKSLGSLYDKRPEEKKKFEDDFKKSLDECLSLKDNVKYSLDDYSNNLFVCGDRVAKQLASTIGEDQVHYSINEYIKDSPKNNLESIRTNLKKELLGNLKTCLQNNKSPDPCIDNLKKSATQKIVLAYTRSETLKQLNTSESPPSMKQVEDAFIKCTSSDSFGEKLSKELDECTKDFAITFAKELGKLKVESILTSALGTDTYREQKSQVDGMMSKFNSCLDDLGKYSMADGFTEKLKICTDDLQNRGLNIVTSNLNNWMNSEQKDSITLSVKNDFAKFIPCLSVLFPSSPYNPQLKGNVDSILKPVAKIFAQYIDYSPENAKKNLAEIIKRLSTDLRDIESNPKSKEQLVDMLFEMGVLDQLIKGVVLDEVKKGFATIKDDDLPKEIRNALTSKENFDKIFNSPDGKELMLFAKDNILKPALVNQVSVGSPAIGSAIQNVKDQVSLLLVQAPTFGDTIIIAGIQSQIKQLPFLYKVFGPLVVGSEAFKWENVRTTPSGKIAETFIREKVLLNKFKGIKLSKDEEEKITKQASDLVSTAVKNYKKEKAK